MPRFPTAVYWILRRDPSSQIPRFSAQSFEITRRAPLPRSQIPIALFWNSNYIRSKIGYSPFFRLQRLEKQEEVRYCTNTIGWNGMLSHCLFIVNLSINPPSSAGTLCQFCPSNGRVVTSRADFFCPFLGPRYNRLLHNLKHAQDTQARYYNANRQCNEFNPGDEGWLLSTNIKTHHSSKKIGWKRLVPSKSFRRSGYNLQATVASVDEGPWMYFIFCCRNSTVTAQITLRFQTAFISAAFRYHPWSRVLSRTIQIALAKRLSR